MDADDRRRRVARTAEISRARTAEINLYDPPIPDEQVSQVRSYLGHLQRFSLDYYLDLARITRLLQPPVTMRWQDIGWIFADAHTSDIIVTLPTLTKLDLWFHEHTPHADFLSQLPLLTTLKLDCRHSPMDMPRRFAILAEPLLASLLPCTGLNELDLNCGFSSEQVGTLLATLTKLRRLKLYVKLKTLQCLASGPATQSLEHLSLYQHTSLPHSELVHMYALQGLRSLSIDQVFESVDEDTLDSLCPPTQLFPRLTQLFCQWHDDEWEWDSVDERGPSYEWMQQRLTL